MVWHFTHKAKGYEIKSHPTQCDQRQVEAIVSDIRELHFYIQGVSVIATNKKKQL